MNKQMPIGKEKILEVSMKEFAAKGYDGVRVDHIAAEAGVNKALIYYHFKSKEELYIACINYMFIHAIPTANENISRLDIKERILLHLTQFITFLHENPLFVKFMDQEVLRGGQLFHRANEQIRLVQNLIKLYEEGVQLGELRQVAHPVDYIVSILGACYFYYSHQSNIRLFYTEQMKDTDILEMRIQTMKEMVINTIFIS